MSFDFLLYENLNLPTEIAILLFFSSTQNQGSVLLATNMTVVTLTINFVSFLLQVIKSISSRFSASKQMAHVSMAKALTVSTKRNDFPQEWNRRCREVTRTGPANLLASLGLHKAIALDWDAFRVTVSRNHAQVAAKSFVLGLAVQIQGTGE